MASWDNWTGAQWQAISAAIGLADGSIVDDGFARIMSGFPDGEWLPRHHVMANPRKSLFKKNPPHSALMSSRIADYAAASVPLHVADAWTYFGRACSAMAMGAPEVAQHLLYYSELRACHALLTRHGVLVLNQKNFVLTGSATATIPIPDGRVAGNSHQALWVVLDSWIKDPRAVDFVGATISMGSAPLIDWMSERPQPDSLATVIAPLMEQWGLDLDRFSRDRDLRNHLSYDPTRLRQVDLGVTPGIVAQTLSEVWGALEPGQSNPFEVLDRYICRQTFESLYRRTHGGAALRRKAYRDFNDQWVDQMYAQGGGAFYREFLRAPHTEPDPTILRLAGRGLDKQPLATQLLGMFGRALILLRMSTGALRDLMVSAGATTATVEFWIEDMLVSHGVAMPDSSPRDFSELYDEVRDYAYDLEPLIGEDGGSLADFRVEFGTQLEGLSTFERVPAWSVA